MSNERCPKCGAEKVEYDQNDPRSKQENWSCGTYRRGSRLYESTYCELRIAEAECDNLRAENERLQARLQRYEEEWGKC